MAERTDKAAAVGMSGNIGILPGGYFARLLSDAPDVPASEPQDGEQAGVPWWWPRCSSCGRWIARQSWPRWDSSGPTRCESCHD
jgi:hypothetical protein